jgi:hypothetical protein
MTDEQITDELLYDALCELKDHLRARSYWAGYANVLHMLASRHRLEERYKFVAAHAEDAQADLHSAQVKFLHLSQACW